MDPGAADRLRVRVPAKINLHLAVGPRRSDGYHELVSVMQTVSLFDTLRIHRDDDGQAAHPSARRRMRLALTFDGHDELPIEDNLVVRAARAVMTAAGFGGDGQVAAHDDPAAPCTHLHLTKRIPVAAGMAGGSADAAAALVGLNSLWDAGLTSDMLRELAAGLGADVPFCLVGGTALATGSGTSVARVLTRGTACWVIGADDRPLSTAEVYAQFDVLPTPAPREPDLVLHALRTGDLEMLAASLHNDLEPAAFALRPELADRRDAMRAAGALGAIVSGSGPTVLGLARDPLHARQLAAALTDVFPRVETVTSPAGGPDLLQE